MSKRIFTQKPYKPYASGTRFWLVKPKASITGISGLDALVSGNYIALTAG